MTEAVRISLMLCLLGSASAWAGSNLVSGDYPEPQCGERPSPPERPAVFESESQIESYNQQVKAYNTRVESYYACIQTYVDNALQDIARIKAKTRAVVDQANQ